jgi:hydroxymethylglutaryl-CoA lyase
MPTADSIKLVECPRDAWQGLQGQIPTYIKIDYLNALISAGFKHIDAASFVSPKAVPQMADSDEVMKELDPPDDVEIIGIVVNERGAERAIQTNAVRTLGFPYSISPTFLQNNQRQTLEEAIEELEKIGKKAGDAGLETIVYISMAFGNPYGDLWNPDELVEAVGLLESEDIHTISLADTVGVATPAQVREVVFAVLAKARMMRAAAGLTLLSGALGDAHSHRTRWWETSQLRRFSKRSLSAALRRPSPDRWMFF